MPRIRSVSHNKKTHRAEKFFIKQTKNKEQKALQERTSNNNATPNPHNPTSTIDRNLARGEEGSPLPVKTGAVRRGSWQQLVDVFFFIDIVGRSLQW